MQRIKGTQDFIDLSLFNFIVDQARTHCEQYNFSEIATPIMEPTELFKRSLGLNTDVVNKEMYVLDMGESGDEICLRPEATASTVRAFVENGIQVTPWKVFSWGPIFRHERPQKGRFRQFHQFNLEAIGTESISQDANIISLLETFFKERLKLTEFALVINFLGSYEDRATYTTVLHTFLETIADKICATCQVRKDSNIMRVFDCKNPDCKKLYLAAPVITDNLCEASQKEWQQLQEELELLSISFTHDPRLVRGLDYYNKTVFEFVSMDLGSQNAFCGGGRYGRLVEAVGGRTDQPAIGAAMGIERLMMLLEPLRDQLAIPQPQTLSVIMPMDEHLHPLALLLSQNLHLANITNDILFEGSIKSMMKKANKMGAAYAIILGTDEQKTQSVTVKNMITGTSETVAQNKVAAFLKR